MKVLLDTNAFLKWCLEERVPRKAEKLLISASSNLLVSVITPWEIAIKQAKLRDKSLTNSRIEKAIEAMSAQMLPVLLKHVEALVSLPEHHADPFDRMLIAQAIAENAVVVSSDERFPLYKSAGLHVIWG